LLITVTIKRHFKYKNIKYVYCCHHRDYWANWGFQKDKELLRYFIHNINYQLIEQCGYFHQYTVNFIWNKAIKENDLPKVKYLLDQYPQKLNYKDKKSDDKSLIEIANSLEYNR